MKTYGVILSADDAADYIIKTLEYKGFIKRTQTYHNGHVLIEKCSDTDPKELSMEERIFMQRLFPPIYLM